MSQFTPIVDWNAIMQGYLRLADADATNVQKAYTAFAAQLQDIDGVQAELVEARSIATATGLQLDRIGELVGEPRRGRSDAAYRQGIYVRIAANRSGGTADTVLGIIATITGAATGTVSILFHYPAAYDLIVIAPPILPQPGIQALIESATAAGVRVYVVIVPVTTGYFGFFEDPNALGFDDGEFAGIFV